MEQISAVVVGIIILYVAWLIGSKKKINLLYAHYHKRVAPEDKDAYCYGMGRGLGVVGLSVLLSCPIDLLSNNTGGIYMMILGMMIGLTWIHNTQKRYNGGWR